MTRRNLVVIALSMVLGACALGSGTKEQPEVCQTCGDNGDDWIDPGSPEAEAAAGAVLADTGTPADACRWQGGCVVCWVLPFPPQPWNNVAYACRVCTTTEGRRCGSYNLDTGDFLWALTGGSGDGS